MKSSTSLLTHKEGEMLYLIAKDHSTLEISNKLCISPHTVISHRKNLKRKLDARTTAGMIYKAFEKGFLKLNHKPTSKLCK